MTPTHTQTAPPRTESALAKHLEQRDPAEAKLLARWLANFATAAGNDRLAARLREIGDRRTAGL